MTRLLLLPIHDGATDFVECEGGSCGYEGRHWRKRVTVPYDDQLARDLDFLTSLAITRTPEHMAKAREAADRLRAAAGLGGDMEDGD